MKEVWEKQYKEKSAPWNYDGFDEDFRKFLKIRFSENCTVIDLGCGNGSQVHHIEKLGFEVTVTDVVNALEYDIKNFIFFFPFFFCRRRVVSSFFYTLLQYINYITYIHMEVGTIMQCIKSIVPLPVDIGKNHLIFY